MRNNIQIIGIIVLVLIFGTFLRSQNMKRVEKTKIKVLIVKIDKTKTIGNKSFVILNKKYVLYDNNGKYIYKLVDNYGIKTYILFEKYKENELIIKNGIKKGDSIISNVLIEIDDELIKGRFISKSNKVSVAVMQEDNLVNRFKTVKKNQKGSFFKNSKLEFFIGIGFLKNVKKYENLYLKEKAVEELLKQYAAITDHTFSSSGVYEELRDFKPINFGVNFKIVNGLYIKGGVEFASISVDSKKEYNVNWDGFDEIYMNDFSHKLSYTLPYFGIEKRFNDFGLYINIGLNTLKYNYESLLNFSEQNYWEKTTEIINGNGTSFSIIAGLKYKLRIVNRLHGFIKLEYLMSKFSSLEMERTLNSTNSEGATFSESTSGLIYTFNMNPNNLNKVNSWGVYDSVPDTNWMGDFNELVLDLSTIRLTIGLSF